MRRIIWSFFAIDSIPSVAFALDEFPLKIECRVPPKKDASAPIFRFEFADFKLQELRIYRILSQIESVQMGAVGGNAFVQSSRQSWKTFPVGGWKITMGAVLSIKLNRLDERKGDATLNINSTEDRES